MRASSYFPFVVLAVSLGATLLLYRDTASSIVAQWSRDPLGHGYIVVPIAGWVAWQRRKKLRSITGRPAARALPVLTAVVLLWLLGNLSGTGIVQQVSLVGMSFVLVWEILGWEGLTTLAFPLGFLFFGLPLADRFIPGLQDLAAWLAVKLLRLSHVPVLLQGHVLSIPGGRWQVAEACSGVNYLVASMAFGYMYAGLTYRTWRNRLWFFAAAALLPLVANGFRVYSTILIAHLGGTRIVLGMQHYLYGWFVFAAMLIVLFVTCGRWAEIERLEAIPGDRSTQGPGGRRVLTLAVTAILILASGPYIAARLASPWLETASVQRLSINPPRVTSPWRVSDADAFGWMPRFHGANGEFVRTYESGAQRVKLYVAFYDVRQGAVELASTTNRVFEPPWVPVRTGRRPVALEQQSFRIRETSLEEGTSTLVVWSWYSVDGTYTGNDYLAKALLARARLVRSGKGAAAIVLAAQDGPALNSDASTVLANFLAHLSLSDSLALRPAAIESR